MEHFEGNKFLFGGYFQFQLAVLCDIQLDEQIAQNYSVCDVQFQLSNKRVRRSVLGEDNQLSNVGKNGRREVEQGAVWRERALLAHKPRKQFSRVLTAANSSIVQIDNDHCFRHRFVLLFGKKSMRRFSITQ